MLKVIELFSGYRSQSLALKYLRVEYRTVGVSEIDKYAIQAANLIHNDNAINFGDITKINEKELPDCDLLTYSFPCVSISIAGKQEGLSEDTNTKSSLLWECRRIIQYKKPKYLLMENVKNLVSKKFKPEFDKWLKELEEMGYNNYWQVLNAKNFGICQNRERVFCISILKDFDEGYNFPEEVELKFRLKDILEDNVDEKYYISNEKTKLFLEQIYKKNKLNNLKIAPNQINDVNGQKKRVYSVNNIAPTITTMGGTNEYPMVCEQRVDEGVRFFKDNVCGSLRTIDSCGDKRIIEPKIYDKTDYRIRKLTPKECFRLQGMKDEDIDKLDSISNSQQYKLAGNSICIPVLMGIFGELFGIEYKSKIEDWKY